jgi:hypothetical protein
MPSSHRECLPIALGTFALVTLFGIFNDQAIVRIAPEHFTVFHPHYFPVQQPGLLALCFAVVATGGPGLAWGIALYWAGHYGPGPAVGTRATISGVLLVLFITVASAWSLGWHVHQSHQPLYPRFFYPTDEIPLYITQTVQLTNYLVGVSGALVWIAAIQLYRRHQAR